MLYRVAYSKGCDPEAFFQKDGRIIGSERIIPEDGLNSSYYKADIIRDGVQFELNPPACSSSLALYTNIKSAMTKLYSHLKNYPGVSCNFDGVVAVERDEIANLSYKSRMFNCAPSLNIYNLKPMQVDPETYLTRSAGGHPHFGLTNYQMSIYSMDAEPVDERQRLIALLDIFLGNTSVLLDRNPLAVERRKTYGMAGEFRLPRYGVEYRTLSNFWLRSYSLCSFLFGMADIAISVLVDSLKGGTAEQDIIDAVDLNRVIRAIQENDFDLAMRNFEDIIPFIGNNTDGTFIAVNSTNIKEFIKFANNVRTDGLSRYFSKEPIDSWLSDAPIEFNALLNKGV